MDNNKLKRIGGNVINSNDEEYQSFIQSRNRIIREKQLQDRVDNLEKEVSSLKQILRDILSRID